MSVLPPPQKDGEITFFMAKSLPYRPRMALVGLLLAAGLGTQVTAGFWPGYALLVLGLLLGVNSGYNSSPARTGEESWERVTPDAYEKVKLKAEQLKAWDEDLFDGTSTLGLAGFGVTAALCAGLYAWAAGTWSFPPGYWVYFALDGAVLLLPLWFVGTRGYLKKDKLIIKIGMLEEVMAALKDPSDVQVQPMLSLAPTASGGKEPGDARLMLKLVGAPKEFYGIQVQLSINSVQGKDFPYLYCVLIAKNGSGLLGGWEPLAAQPERSFFTGLVGSIFGQIGNFGSPELVYEPSSAGEVDIMVVRQRTTRATGYHTAPAAALTVVDYSLKLARALLAKNPGTAG
ncbi:MAG: hypothetical protein A2X35_10085 [Elusimicrobia bacterium GWA2_61_42]|nr:MAG: hypothetical protein A2X35_10085 [Elusimicrobia bacterium GWA2_61_42]OGR76661.1 MAG: hypothetical protein A2X38_03735 [Elusimicrobia bacterium GWC2_61_25]